MTPYEVLYGKRCKTPLCWNEVGERQLEGPELVQHTINKIQMIKSRLKAVQDRHKSYADLKRRDIEYNVGDKDHMRFYRLRPVAYRLALPPELSQIHDIFHVSMLRRYRSDPSHILQKQPIELRKDLTYEEESVEIIAKEEKVLRNKIIPLVKVPWSNYSTKEATWEKEENMRIQFSHLFPSPGM
ncbi:uncharacterized protein LOC122725013 [Manihot esculenta]|uniref:uncharacterized protein LOC122725013 n=1 Tax=Manihot esculenta TaxID=3983 RepID=UPI001CC4D911|nr:uncharacterized protein LOC122725013 [Manihot esculenta]